MSTGLEDIRNARERLTQAREAHEQATEEFLATVQLAKAHGVGVSAIAKEFDITRAAVYDWLSRAPVTRPE